jgi:hypothetical protein
LDCLFFKVAYNSLMIIGVGRRIVEDWLGIELGDSMLLGLSILNNVIVPYIAEMFVSPDCFHYAITPAPAITSYFIDFDCSTISRCDGVTCQLHVFCPYSIEILASKPIEFSISPPFQYSYQCSSSLLTAFSYIFVYRYLITGLIDPIFILILKLIQHACIKHSSTTSTSISTEVESKTDVESTTGGKTSSNSSFNQLLFQAATMVCPMLWNMVEEDDIVHDETDTLTSNSIQKDMIETAFQAEERICSKRMVPHIRQTILVPMITDWTMMLCFGAMFPPLAIIIAISAWKDRVVRRIGYNRLLRCIYLASAEEAKEELHEETGMSENSIKKMMKKKERLVEIMKNVNAALEGMEEKLQMGMRWSIAISSIFWSYSLFDTLGDAVGAGNAYWIILVIVLVSWMGTMLLSVIDWKAAVNGGAEVQQKKNRGEEEDHSIDGTMRGSRIELERYSDVAVEVSRIFVDVFLHLLIFGIYLAIKSASQ